MRRLLLLLVPALLAGCLENEETIAVRPDGSVHVRVRARGDRKDLAEGHAVPAGAPWTALPGATGLDQDQEERIAEATFASVRDWPRFHAPASEPYQTAFLERSADLKIERKGARTVYTFERTFHARPWAGFEPWHRVGEAIPKEIDQKFKRKETPTSDEWVVVARAVQQALRDSGDAYARDALLGLYTVGDAELSAAASRAIERRVADALGALAPVDRLQRLVADLDAAERAKASPAGPHPFERFEGDVLSTLRGTFSAALAETGLRPKVQNAVLARLEWRLAAIDHTSDLGDETFKVRVTLPGVVVGGNYAGRAAEGTVTWELKGEDLRDRDVVLRAVSVVE
jgi:hypothetical protein